MAVTVTDLRTIRNEADATTGWQGSPNLFTSQPDPVEATGSIGYVVSNATVNAYHLGTAVNLSNALVYVWVRPFGAMDTTANGGVALLLGDGTNLIGFHLAGSDSAGFQHADGPVEWQCIVVDTQNLPSVFTARAGSRANLNLSAITGIGAMFKTLFKSVGGVSNCFIDILRHGSVETLQISGGTSGDPGLFSEISALDRSTANQRAHGVVRRLGAGLFGIQGPLRFGNPTSGNTWFQDLGTTVVFEARGFTTTRYRINIVRGTGTTHFQLGTKVGTDGGEDGCTIIVPPGVGAEFDADTETSTTDVRMYASVLRGFTNGLGFQSGHEFIASQVDASGTIRANGASFLNSRITASTAATALLWNVNLNTNGRLDGCVFASAGTGHAIELGPNCPTEITLANMTYTGYGANGTTNAALYNNSGKSITVNVLGGGSPTVRNGAGASTTIQNTQLFRVTGLIPDSEVRVYRISDGEELAGVENSTTEFEFVYNYTGDVPINVYIHNIQYQWLGIASTLTANGVTIPVQQRFDRVYFNPD